MYNLLFERSFSFHNRKPCSDFPVDVQYIANMLHRIFYVIYCK